MTALPDFFSRFHGELAALACAAIWAGATLYFKKLGGKFTASYLNFFKCLIALILILATAVFTMDAVPYIPNRALLLLLASGFVGIGVGDTAYFESLHYLGARRSLLMGILAPPITGFMAFAFLGEALAPLAWLGIILTISGVAWVVSERTPDSGPQESGHLIRGIVFGSFYAVCQAAGSVLTRSAFLSTDIDVLGSVILRLIAGLVFLMIWIVLRRPRLGEWIREKGAIKTWVLITWATFIGTYLALIFQQIALKHANAGVAQTLLMTSHLFIIPIMLWKGKKISLRALIGALIGTGGIVILFVIK